MNHAYVVPGVVDAAVVREKAHRRLTDRLHPEETTVHYHRYGEHCDARCEVFDAAYLKAAQEADSK